MITDTSNAADQAAIRKVIETWADAVRERNVAGLLANIAPDILFFDLINPLQHYGSDALKKRADAWLASFKGTLAHEIRDLDITAGDDVAFCHSLNRVIGTKTDGEEIDMWWRVTIGLRKIAGVWTVTHEHSSVPFDMETGKASLGLKP
jgi:ketosteroid isomerase-like protein